MTLTSDDRAKLERLLTEATPRPWRVKLRAALSPVQEATDA